jgi:DNA excision repair protein ERCC-5
LKNNKAETLRKTAEKLLESRLKLAALKNISQALEDDLGDNDDDYIEKGTRNTAAVDHSQLSTSQARDKIVAEFEFDEYLIPSSQRNNVVVHDPKVSADFRLPIDVELYDFINARQTRQQIDLNRVNIDSEEFNSLALEKQHEIILNLKNASRIPSQERVDEMVKSSKTAAEFSKAQIRNLVHRATLTERYHSTLKGASLDENGRVVKRVEGSRQRMFFLEKNETGLQGWTMSSKGKM